MFNIKEFVALDMVLNGKIFIVSEFIIGTFLPLVLIYCFLYVFPGTGISRELWIVWLTGQTFNYAPMMWYAIEFAKNNNYKEYSVGLQTRPKINEVSLKQIVVLIPFVVFIFALFQLKGQK